MSCVAAPLLSTTHAQTPCHWANGWSNEDIQRIVEHCETLPKLDAKIGGDGAGGVDRTVRRGQVAWVGVTEESRWFMQRLMEQAMALNRDFCGFDLWGFETAQYTVYQAEGQGDTYDWHIDTMGKGNAGQRKLSIVLQLSDQQEYEGGELWLHGHTKEVVQKAKGLLVAFPSYTLHRVTPVTAGIRRTLVTWILGPQFR
jgi:PKHD-type hydroxylase